LQYTAAGVAAQEREPLDGNYKDNKPMTKPNICATILTGISGAIWFLGKGDMEPTAGFDQQRAIEAASTLLAWKGRAIEYLWLIKMLYLADREAILRWERPITYDAYTSMDNGPVLLTVYNMITGNVESREWKSFIVSYPKRSAFRYLVANNGAPARIKKLSTAELELMREVYDRWGSHSWRELIEITHELPEWTDPGGGKSIPIALDYLLRKMNFSAGDIGRIQSEIKEEEALDEVLGT
jgi:uncharacterized phage-associated protein